MIWSGIPSGRHSIFIIYLRIKIFLLTFVVINYKKFTDISGGDKETREMIDLLADADAGLRFDITSGFNKKTYSISLSAAEIKKLQNK